MNIDICLENGCRAEQRDIGVARHVLADEDLGNRLIVCSECKEEYEVSPGFVALQADIDAGKYCTYCVDGSGGSWFPHYGVAPHTHDFSIDRGPGNWIGSTVVKDIAEWPENFREDPEAPGCGVYMYCPECGAGDKGDEGTILASDAQWADVTGDEEVG